MKTINYPVGDFLIRVKNASKTTNKEIKVQKSKLIKAVANLLHKGGYLSDVSESGNFITAKLAYMSKAPVLMDVRLVSTPGLRVYKKYLELSNFKKPSKLIVSTPSGLMFAPDAVKRKLGGEVIAEIL